MMDCELFEVVDRCRKMVHGKQLRRLHELAGQIVDEDFVDDQFYVVETPHAALFLASLVREARERVDEQMTPPSWMAL